MAHDASACFENCNITDDDIQLLWCKIGFSLAESKKEFQHEVEDDVSNTSN